MIRATPQSRRSVSSATTEPADFRKILRKYEGHQVTIAETRARPPAGEAYDPSIWGGAITPGSFFHVSRSCAFAREIWTRRRTMNTALHYHLCGTRLATRAAGAAIGHTIAGGVLSSVSSALRKSVRPGISGRERQISCSLCSFRSPNTIRGATPRFKASSSFATNRGTWKVPKLVTVSLRSAQRTRSDQSCSVRRTATTDVAGSVHTVKSGSRKSPGYRPTCRE
jgi:hypothetical protein